MLSLAVLLVASLLVASAGAQAGCISNASAACSGCSSICRLANPAYDQGCKEIKVVLILDESGSINAADAVPAVRQAIKDFTNGLLAVSKNGTEVRLGVISFNAYSDVDFPLSKINDTFISQVNAWADGASSPSGTKGYYVDVDVDPAGWTNWRNALKLAADTWPTTGLVDVYVWFTDGRPETSDAVGPPECDNYCYTPANAYFDNLCLAPNTCLNGGPSGLLLNDEGSSLPYVYNQRPRGAWAASTYADAVKSTGAKLFMVGVGGILESEDVAQLVTGFNRWDGLPETFGQSDYMIGEDLQQLGSNLTAVLKGLCPSGPNVGAIVGGVIAGIVVAVVVGLLIAAFFTWKGVQYYQASHSLSGAGANNNALYSESANAGNMPDYQAF